MLHTNIRVNSSIERGLLSRIRILLNKKRDLLDGFDNDSVIGLELDAESASIPHLNHYFPGPLMKKICLT